MLTIEQCEKILNSAFNVEEEKPVISSPVEEGTPVKLEKWKWELPTEEQLESVPCYRVERMSRNLYINDGDIDGDIDDDPNVVLNSDDDSIVINDPDDDSQTIFYGFSDLIYYSIYRDEELGVDVDVHFNNRVLKICSEKYAQYFYDLVSCNCRYPDENYQLLSIWVFVDSDNKATVSYELTDERYVINCASGNKSEYCSDCQTFKSCYFKEYIRLTLGKEDEELAEYFPSKPKKSRSLKQHVYILEMSNGTIKIGVSKNVKKRAARLRTGSGLEILRVCYTKEKTEDAHIIEGQLHEIFEAERAIGEYFTTEFERAREMLEKELPIIDKRFDFN